jgi:hypothetical protein
VEFGATGDGVYGQTGGPGSGLDGTTESASAIGVLAENSAGGTALKVSGRAEFSRSDVATVAAGSESVKVTGMPLTPGSMVLATVQQTSGGSYVKAAVPDPGSSSLSIYLNKAPRTSRS